MELEQCNIFIKKKCFHTFWWLCGAVSARRSSWSYRQTGLGGAVPQTVGGAAPSSKAAFPHLNRSKNFQDIYLFIFFSTFILTFENTVFDRWLIGAQRHGSVYLPQWCPKPPLFAGWELLVRECDTLFDRANRCSPLPEPSDRPCSSPLFPLYLQWHQRARPASNTGSVHTGYLWYYCWHKRPWTSHVNDLCGRRNGSDILLSCAALLITHIHHFQ